MTTVLTKYNEIVVDENAIIEMFLQDLVPTSVTMTDTKSVEIYNHFCELFLLQNTHIDAEPAANCADKYSYKNVCNWWMPNEYKEINLYNHLSDCLEKHLKCHADGDRMYGTDEWKRVCEEMDLYSDRGLLPLLKFLVYMVDTMREHGIVWGVGRGSSVASYVLYLIGVHRIDSVKYNLNFKEFLR